MFDFGWSELTLLGVVALVVIGPKDLPRVLRTVGTYTRKARSIAREFQNSVEDMIREAELDDVKKHFDTARNFDIKSELNKAIDPDGSIREHLTPPVLPSVTMDAAPPPPLIDAAEDPALPPPTIHTPIGSEPSATAPEGIDPHPPDHHAAAADPLPPAEPVSGPHPGTVEEAAEHAAPRERALPPVAP